MEFSKDKCEVMLVGQTNPVHKGWVADNTVVSWLGACKAPDRYLGI